MTGMFYQYGKECEFSGLDLSSFNTSKVDRCSTMLSDIKLKTITLGKNFNLDLSTSGASLTDSSGNKDST